MTNRIKSSINLLPAVIAIVGMAFSTSAAALGLGALKIQSNLDQPLKGSIELRVAQGDDVSSLQAAIASEDDFAGLGVDYPSYLSDMTLEMVNTGDDYVLQVSSGEVVIKEPFIHFLVRVDWSGGSFLREYTALIDPPLYASESPSNIVQPKIVGVDESFQVEEEPEISVTSIDEDSYVEPLAEPSAYNDVNEYPSDESSVSSEEVIQDQSYLDDSYEPVTDTGNEYQEGSRDAQYGPVVSGESLSVIAQELQSQFPDLSIYQIMKVLFEENENAFIQGNINGLKKGAVLKIGDLDAIRAVEIASGRSFFYEHLNNWSPAIRPSNSYSDNNEIALGQDEYSYSPEDDYASTATTSSTSEATFQVGSSNVTQGGVSNGDSQTSEVVALQQQISDLESSLSSRSLENQELVERISMLEGQLSDMNRLMSLNVESAELAGVESVLAEQNNSESSTYLSDDADEILSEVDSEQVTNESSFNSESKPSPELDEVVTGENPDGFLDSIADLDSSKAQTPETAVTTAPKVSVSQPVSRKTETSMFAKISAVLFDNGMWKLLAGLGALLAGALAFLFVRRRRADEEYEISMLSIETQSQYGDDETKSKNSVQGGGGSDKDTSFLTVYSDSDAVVQADEVDPIAEADVYIAYGRDEQAEEVLLDGVASKPNRLDIKHKLLSLYHKNRNVEGFERIAEELYSQKSVLTRDTWQSVADMGKNLSPSNPLFNVSEAEIFVDDQEASEAGSSAEEPAAEVKESATATIAGAGAAIAAVAANLDVGDDDELELNISGSDTGQNQASNDAIQQDPSAETSTLEFDAEVSEPSSSDDEEIDIAFAEDDMSIHLINFDDGRSEISELDEIAIDDLEIDDNEDDPQIDVESEQVIDIASEIELDDGEALELSNIVEPQTQRSQKLKDEFAAEVSDLEVDEDYDESRTQYELAKVFIDLGDEDGARKILSDIVTSDDASSQVLGLASELLATINN